MAATEQSRSYAYPTRSECVHPKSISKALQRSIPLHFLSAVPYDEMQRFAKRMRLKLIFNNYILQIFNNYILPTI